MENYDIARLIYLGLLVLVIGGYFFAQSRDNLGKTAQQAIIWVLLFVGVIAGYGLWQDVERHVTGTPDFSSDQISLPRQRDGHFYVDLTINGARVSFVVDTGATNVVLSKADARAVGLNPDTLDYYGSANTANGVVAVAPVRLDRVVLGSYRDENIYAVVNGGELSESLLGMDYLGRFERIEIVGNRMILTR